MKNSTLVYDVGQVSFKLGAASISYTHFYLASIALKILQRASLKDVEIDMIFA